MTVTKIFIVIYGFFRQVATGSGSDLGLRFKNILLYSYDSET